MSICTTESLSSRIALDRMHMEEENQRQRECGLRLHLAAMVRAGDVSAPVTVAEPVPVRFRGQVVDRRFPTLAEILLEAFDYSKGPQLSEVFAFLIGRANSGDAAAQSLIERAIAEWARNNAEDMA